MSDGLIARLRSGENQAEHAAADEIERLRAAIETALLHRRWSVLADAWEERPMTADDDTVTIPRELAERLAMAEGLLRKAASLEDPPYLALGRHQMTTNEVAYLRSLDGEDNTDA